MASLHTTAKDEQAVLAMHALTEESLSLANMQKTARDRLRSASAKMAGSCAESLTLAEGPRGYGILNLDLLFNRVIMENVVLLADLGVEALHLGKTPAAASDVSVILETFWTRLTRLETAKMISQLTGENLKLINLRLFKDLVQKVWPSPQIPLVYILKATINNRLYNAAELAQLWHTIGSLISFKCLYTYIKQEFEMRGMKCPVEIGSFDQDFDEWLEKAFTCLLERDQ